MTAPALDDDRDAVVDAPSGTGLTGALGRLGTAAWVLLLAALLVTIAVVGLRYRDASREADLRADALAAARQEALNLTSVDATDTEGDLKRVLESASGQFRQEFEATSGNLGTVTKDNKVKAEGTVLDAGLSRFDGDAATAVLVVDHSISNKDIPDGQVRHYRISMDVERVGDRWLTSSLQIVG